MAGYVPLFDSIATGTLYGRWPDIGVWPIVLALADKNGHLDVTPHYLAGVLGLPVEDVSACMRRFCDTDPYSRSKDENGARLVLIDTHRDWGWVIVNHCKYAEKARKKMQQSAATESGKDAARKRAERSEMSGDVQSCPAMSSRDRLSYSDSSSDSTQEKSKRAQKRPTAPEDFKPDRTYQRIPADMDLDAEIEKFKIWEFKTPHSDWNRTWKRWVMEGVKRGDYARRGGKPIVWR